MAGGGSEQGREVGRRRRTVSGLWLFSRKLVIPFCCRLSMRYLEKIPLHFVRYDLRRLHFFLSLPFLVDQN